MSFSDGKKILPITPYTLYYTHLKNAALIHDLKKLAILRSKKNSIRCRYNTMYPPPE